MLAISILRSIWTHHQIYWIDRVIVKLLGQSTVYTRMAIACGAFVIAITVVAVLVFVVRRRLNVELLPAVINATDNSTISR